MATMSLSLQANFTKTSNYSEQGSRDKKEEHWQVVNACIYLKLQSHKSLSAGTYSLEKVEPFSDKRELQASS